MSDHLHQLDYAPVRRRSLVARIVRWSLVILLLAGVVLGVCYRQKLSTQWANGRAWYLQRQCLRHTRPAELLVFQQCASAEEAAALVATGNYVLLRNQPMAGYAPHSVALKHPDLYTKLRSSTYNGYAFLFMHEMSTPDGRKRLVIVPTCTSIGRGEPDYPPNVELDPEVHTIAPWGGMRMRAGLSFLFFPRQMTKNPHRLKMWAGQLDPNDPTRFTIRYEWDGAVGTIDGSLGDDARITMTFRDGPAKQFLRSDGSRD